LISKPIVTRKIISQPVIT